MRGEEEALAQVDANASTVERASDILGSVATNAVGGKRAVQRSHGSFRVGQATRGEEHHVVGGDRKRVGRIGRRLAVVGEDQARGEPSRGAGPKEERLRHKGRPREAHAPSARGGEEARVPGNDSGVTQEATDLTERETTDVDKLVRADGRAAHPWAKARRKPELIEPALRVALGQPDGGGNGGLESKQAGGRSEVRGRRRARRSLGDPPTVPHLPEAARGGLGHAVHQTTAANRTPQLELARPELASNKQHVLPPVASTKIPEAVKARRSRSEHRPRIERNGARIGRERRDGVQGGGELEVARG